MGCSGCSVGSNGQPKGCRSNGGCDSGGCNRLNTFDWLSSMHIEDSNPFDIVEVSFKNGARKGFYRKKDYAQAVTGDLVVVETGNGHDIGEITLSGDLVRLQLKKKKTKASDVLHEIIRRANQRDEERLDEARSLEHQTMVRARAIARTLGLEMKVGDVEYQGDKRKATFYYTADGRVDFRELIRHYAKEFRIKVEMRQIGARQESARIGGIGSCGRELCCSTWLTDFKSVSTSAARYQNLAINQAKLSGQCGRLKCCLNYELDTYMEALEAFPEQADRLYTEAGQAILLKTDIFKGIMYYAYDHERGRGKVYPLSVEIVAQIRDMNKNGEKPSDFAQFGAAITFEEPEEEIQFADVTGEIELPEEKKRRKKKKRNRGRNRNQKGGDQKRNNSSKTKEVQGKSQKGNNTPNNGSKNAGQKGTNKKRNNNRFKKRGSRNNGPNNTNSNQKNNNKDNK